MTAYLLLRSLRRFMEQQAAAYAAALGTDDEAQAIRVFDWDLPFPDPQHPEGIAYPYICVRPVSGLDREEAVQPDMPATTLASTVDIAVVFGVYRGGTEPGESVAADGYDLLNLMEQVRTSLFQQRILDGKFAIEKPYHWEISREQPPAYWIGQAQSVWTVPSIVPAWEEVHLHG